MNLKAQLKFILIQALLSTLFVNHLKAEQIFK